MKKKRVTHSAECVDSFHGEVERGAARLAVAAHVEPENPKKNYYDDVH